MVYIFLNFYIRFFVDVLFDTATINTIVYQMSDIAKRERSGESFNAGYRRICSDGAAAAGIFNAYQEDL